MDRKAETLRRVALASTLCLAGLMALTLLSGASQQTFEIAAAPQAYAAGLLKAAEGLRRIVALDDVFIVCYVSATLLLVRELSEATTGGPDAKRSAALLPWISTLGAGAGLLDFIENHHILAMLRLAEHGVAPDPWQLSLRDTFSSLKWLLGHMAFFMVGLCLPTGTWPLRLFRWALLFVQLPVGALALAWADAMPGHALNWLRLFNVLGGFMLLALLVPLPREGGSGAQA